ncbi:DUF1269 domain-containing protein [Puerhibacterium puerhi]|uniref:DUF1269 domain-containing protein n=1 Tax=Puerhibacterium puerhi TaxID=2692623 RepID=UPI001357119D|nr:DUF1269 domain-containing protein [Puerhibacterium puerhi]
MTTFTVWKYDEPEAAQRTARILQDAAADGLVTVVDHAVVSWPPGADAPTMHHSHDAGRRTVGWGAFWGALVGTLFLAPVAGAAVGAAAGGAKRAVDAVGIDEEQLERIRSEVTPGTSALFAVTEGADLDRLGERFHGVGGRLVETNLTPAERSTLAEVFDV